MNIVSRSHPWHTECHCFETAIFDFGEDMPSGWIIWIEGDSGETVGYRRIIHDNMNCVCRRCRIAIQEHAYIDSAV
jgi:hypothetical protein